MLRDAHNSDLAVCTALLGGHARCAEQAELHVGLPRPQGWLRRLQLRPVRLLRSSPSARTSLCPFLLWPPTLSPLPLQRLPPRHARLCHARPRHARPRHARRCVPQPGRVPTCAPTRCRYWLNKKLKEVKSLQEKRSGPAPRLEAIARAASSVRAPLPLAPRAVRTPCRKAKDGTPTAFEREGGSQMSLPASPPAESL